MDVIKTAPDSGVITTAEAGELVKKHIESQIGGPRRELGTLQVAPLRGQPIYSHANYDPSSRTKFMGRSHFYDLQLLHAMATKLGEKAGETLAMIMMTWLEGKEVLKPV
ncbi:MAG: hypothetical protein L6R35_002028 [Caloplaca aegaea]|nr:MAG: hypothetical protein L6R35_002028 [Caloplaca aegaea]